MRLRMPRVVAAIEISKTNPMTQGSRLDMSKTKICSQCSANWLELLTVFTDL